MRSLLLPLAALMLTACVHDGAASKVDPKPASTLERGRVLFWKPEEQVANYPNMEKVFPANVIKRGSKVMPLPKAKDELKVSIPVRGETWTIDDYVAKNRAAGLLVIKDGEIVLERYGLGFSEKGRWTSFSVAKSFSSTLVGAAVKDGFIKSIEDPITTYLPGLKGSAYDGVSIRQVLQMTSGVKWNEDYGDANSDVAKFSAEPSVNGSDPVVTYMARLQREAEPGTRWVYKTGETNLVGSLVRAATRKTLSQYLSEKVWKPVGMEQDGIWMTDDTGGEVAGCCLSATLRDYGRFAMFFMNGAQVDGKSILPDGWIKAATTTTDVAKQGLNGTGGYGYQWWVTNGAAYRASGIFGQGIWINPAKKLIVVSQSAWPGATDPQFGAARQAMIDAVEADYPH